MRCPFCNFNETKVTDKRESNEGFRRRRECLHCKKRFTTREAIIQETIVVVKKDGRREAFDANKMRSGFIKACEKRPISYDKIDNAVREIETKIRKSNKKEVKSDFIGELVMNKLKKLDDVAYIRFASVYRSFADITSFESELKKLRKK
ncbi:MAG: transcriptional regulator NrdR [archaeon]